MKSKPQNRIPATDAEKLRWKGVLGHAYVVLTDTAGASEVSSLEDAKAQAEEYGADQHPRIYRQYRQAKWRPVP